jgi:hypothetical protein
MLAERPDILITVAAAWPVNWAHTALASVLG